MSDKQQGKLSQKNELLSVKNVGAAMAATLNEVGIFTIEQLKNEDPRFLYLKISNAKSKLQDTKMYDMCVAAVKSANGNTRHWSEWSKIRIEEIRTKMLMLHSA